MPNCCVKSYRKKSSASGNVSIFRIPKDQRDAYEKAIGNSTVLPKDARICNRHFEDSDIIKKSFSVINGVQGSTRLELRQGALPTRNLSNEA